MKDLGKAKDIVGIELNWRPDSLTLTQSGYINQMLEKYVMSNGKRVPTPGVPALIINEEDKRITDNTEYRGIVGSLLYLANGTTPDIAYAVQHCSQYVEKATITELKAAKRILRYIAGTSHYGIKLKRSIEKHIKVKVYCDASYASGRDRKFISGEIVELNGSNVIWSSRKQSVIAQSTVEAEYIAMAVTAKQLAWLRQLLGEMNIDYQKPFHLMKDNQGSIALSDNPILSRRSKHNDVRFHYIRQEVENGHIQVLYCPTKEQNADLLTKYLYRVQHDLLCEKVGLYSRESVEESPYARDDSEGRKDI